jgi:hypothetical protein
MDTLINNNKGFKTFVKINDVFKPEGYSEVEFFTVYESAKYPEGKQTKYRVVLSAEERQKLKDCL